jgi:2-deoxy-D-gluconate 3-dehydrogenase
MNESVKNFTADCFNLTGKVAIVTGGHAGLGLAFSVALAKAGADLFITCHRRDTDEARQAIEAEGRRVVFLKGDLADKDYRKTIIPECVKAYGKVDILVNNANVGYFAPFEEYPDEYFENSLEIGLKSAYYLGREAGILMKKQGGGKIINIGSALSFTADRSCPGYVVVKHGIVGLTRDLANELGAYNVQCNALCPGFFKSELTSGVPKEIAERVSAQLPGGKWGEHGDLMGPIIFLASKASDYINGTTLNADGGFSAVI